LNGIHKLFKDVQEEEIRRPTGEIDVLIGFEYAKWYLQREQCADHLLVLKNHFRKCIGGTHPKLKERTETHKLNSLQALYVTPPTVEDFYKIENLGIECTPQCGSCKCGKCHLGSENYTIKEERELTLIKENLSYDKNNR